MARSRLWLALLSLAACAEAPEPLRVHAPARLLQAQASADGGLCARLAVDVTFDEVDLAAPVLDRAPLVPKDDETCTWVLAEAARLPAGTYDLIVRFSIRGSPSSCGPNEVLVGAFVKREVAFPFGSDFEGLTDADFFSSVDDQAAVADLGLVFDPDADQLDNLHETRSNTDPCLPTAPPVLEVQAPATDEGVPVTLVFDVEAQGLPAITVFRVTIEHDNDISLRPEDYQTRTIEVASPGDAAHVLPSILDRPPRERWEARGTSTAVDRFELRFVPDEPFVGVLRLSVVLEDAFGALLVGPVEVPLEVVPQDDPPAVLFDLGDREAQLAAVPFAEVLPPAEAAPQVFRVIDDDLRLVGDPGPITWVPQLESDDLPPGATLLLEEDLPPRWRLRWSPDNAAAIAEPPSGYHVELSFREAGGAERGRTTLPVRVSPRWNDAPSFSFPSPGQRALPADTFVSHTMQLEVRDPDRTAPPLCSLAIRSLIACPGCDAPFESISCTPAAALGPDAWTYEVTLVPAGNYFADYGTSPAMEATFVLLDQPPPGSSNGPRATSEGCGFFAGDACVSPSSSISLRTAALSIATIAAYNPGLIAFSVDSPMVINGAFEAGAFQANVDLDGYTPGIMLADLEFLNPRVIGALPSTAGCSLNDGDLVQGVADEINGRILLLGWRDVGLGCGSGDSEYGVTVVDVSGDLTDAPFDTWDVTEVCPGAYRAEAAVDAAGSFYVVCASDAGIARIDADGVMTREAVPELDGGDDYHPSIVADADGSEWLIVVDYDGVLTIDLDTFDGSGAATPQTVRLTHVDITQIAVVDLVADPWRRSTVFMIERGATDNALLFRVRLDPSPALDLPLDLGFTDHNGFAGLVQRKDGSPSPGEADLVVRPPSIGGDHVYVDLDGWAIEGERAGFNLEMSQGGGCSDGVTTSPDQRYFVGPTSCRAGDSAAGFYFYGWDLAQPGTFVNLAGLPSRGAQSFTASFSGSLLVNAVNDTAYPYRGLIEVHYFVEARDGLDQ